MALRTTTICGGQPNFIRWLSAGQPGPTPLIRTLDITSQVQINLHENTIIVVIHDTCIPLECIHHLSYVLQKYLAASYCNPKKKTSF